MLNYRVKCYLHNLYLLSDSGKWKKNIFNAIKYQSKEEKYAQSLLSSA